MNSAGEPNGAAGSGLTAAQTGTGTYNVTAPGANPGCAGRSPNFVATPFGSGEVSISLITTTCATGNATMTVRTTNSAGVAADQNFFFVLFNGNPVTTSPASRRAPGHPSVCVVSPAGRSCH